MTLTAHVIGGSSIILEPFNFYYPAKPGLRVLLQPHTSNYKLTHRFHNTFNNVTS
jgi:hypothetical protein